MARRCIPDLPALLQFILRLATLGTAIAAIIEVAHDIQKYGDRYAGSNLSDEHARGFGIAVCVVACLVDSWEAVTLLDSKRRLLRIPLAALVGCDIIVLAGAFIVVIVDFVSVNSDRHEGVYQGFETTAMMLLVAVTVESGVLLVLDCMNCCIMPAQRRRLMENDNGSELGSIG